MSENWKDMLDKAKESNSIVYLPKYFNSNISWGEAIRDIEKASKTESDLFPPKVYRGYYQYMMSIPSPYQILDSIMTTVSKEISPEVEIWPSYVQFFANLISENYKTDRHRDNWSAMFLQILGEADWDIFENVDSLTPKESFTVKPGDLILIPRGVVHQVSVLSPRLSLNMAFPSEFVGRYSDYEE